MEAQGVVQAQDFNEKKIKGGDPVSETCVSFLRRVSQLSLGMYIFLCKLRHNFFFLHNM